MVFNSIYTLHQEGRCWALGSDIHAPESSPSQTNQRSTPFDSSPDHLYSHRASNMHALPHSQLHTQQSALGYPGGHSCHPKTWMCTFWDEFASTPPSLGSTDIAFISCYSGPFCCATLRLQKDYEKAADLAPQFWHHIGRPRKPFLKLEIRCVSSFSWLILTPRLWFHALSSFKWNYH